MHLKTIKTLYHTTLDPLYNHKEVDTFFYMLIAFHYGLSRLQFATAPNRYIQKTTPLIKALKELEKMRPIQYILGEVTFCNYPIKVTPHTLIPRPETEELVRWILSQHPAPYSPQKILDIGTGSGCIAIPLSKQWPNAHVYALDISEHAINIAKQNAHHNNANITFIEADILKNNPTHPLLPQHKFDIIVSNPPYVTLEEKQNIKPNVLNNEPHSALFVDNNNPLVFYRAIAPWATHHLSPRGTLYFEINEFFGNAVVQLLEHHKFTKIQLKQDLFGKDRMVKGTLKNPL